MTSVKQFLHQVAVERGESSSPAQKISVATNLTIVNQFFPPDYAATGQLIEELAGELQANFDRVEVFTSQPGYAFKCDDLPTWESDRYLTIRRSQSARMGYGKIRHKALAGLIFFCRTALYLLGHARRRQLVLLTTAPPFLPLLGYLLNLVCRMPYVCLLYDLYPDIAIELNVLPKHHWLPKIWDFCNYLTWKKAAAIIVLNSTMKERTIAKCPSIAHKVVVIPNWADTKQIQPLPKADNWFAHKYNLVERFTVLYSGNLGRCHDVKTILEAMIILRDRPIQFVFIGGGDKRSHLEQQVLALNLTNCLFLPYQTKADLPFSLAVGDVSLVSIDASMEGLAAPSKLYSALAAGSTIAAICPDNSYLKTLIDRANCGATFANGDSLGLAIYLDRLSQNPQLVKQLGASGRKYCLKHYSKAKIAQDYLRLLAAVSYQLSVI